MGYHFIYFGIAFLLAITSGFMLYFSWRYVEGHKVTRWTLPTALFNGFLTWFFCALILILLSDFLQQMAIRWFGANGFSLACILAMFFVWIHYQLLSFLVKK